MLCCKLIALFTLYPEVLLSSLYLKRDQVQNRLFHPGNLPANSSCIANRNCVGRKGSWKVKSGSNLNKQLSFFVLETFSKKWMFALHLTFEVFSQDPPKYILLLFIQRACESNIRNPPVPGYYVAGCMLCVAGWRAFFPEKGRKHRKQKLLLYQLKLNFGQTPGGVHLPYSVTWFLHGTLVGSALFPWLWVRVTRPCWTSRLTWLNNAKIEIQFKLIQWELALAPHEMASWSGLGSPL